MISKTKDLFIARICAKGEALIAKPHGASDRTQLHFIEVQNVELRRLFGEALDPNYYAKACQRVESCMRFASRFRMAGGA